MPLATRGCSMLLPTAFRNFAGCHRPAADAECSREVGDVPGELAAAAGDRPARGSARGHATVLLAVRYQAMRRFIHELLERDCAWMITAELEEDEMLVDALARLNPDVLVIDTADFPACCRTALSAFPRDRVIVIGPEPARDYQLSAIKNGAGAWIPRDHVADALPAVLGDALGGS